MIKVGDKITTNPEWDKHLDSHTWWIKWKNKPMFVRIVYDNIVHVYENNFSWRKDWMIKVKNNFIDEGEFLI
jgi:hypothetical protein